MVEKIRKNGLYTYTIDEIPLSTWYDYVNKFDIEQGKGKVILNGKYNFININGKLLSNWNNLSKVNNSLTGLNFNEVKNKIQDSFYGEVSRKKINKFEYTVPKYLYRISRITNLNSIINKGLLSRNLAKKLVCFEDNSYSNIQDRRLEFSDYNLHDYALLFFSKYSPMIYSKKVSENISDEIILIFDGNLMYYEDILVSEYSLAYSDTSSKDIFEKIYLLHKLDFGLFKKKGWEDNKKLRKKKGAEVLIKNKINFNYVKEIIYFDKFKKEIIETILKENNLNIPITYNNYENYK